MNRLNTLDLLAQLRQQLDGVRRAMVASELSLQAIEHVDLALVQLGEALVQLDSPTVTPSSPWIGSTSPDRLASPTYTTPAP